MSSEGINPLPFIVVGIVGCLTVLSNKSKAAVKANLEKQSREDEEADRTTLSKSLMNFKAGMIPPMTIPGEPVSSLRKEYLMKRFKSHVRAVIFALRLRKIFEQNRAVSGHEALPVFGKSQMDRYFIAKSIEDSFIFSSIKTKDMDSLLNAFEKKVMNANDVIIKEGDDADYFYVIESGEVDFFVQGQQVGSKSTGFFGDLALLRNQKRAATCIASAGGSCVLWRLNKLSYRRVVAKNTTKNHEHIVEIVMKSAIFSQLTQNVVHKIASCMKERTYKKDELIFKKGDIGEEMFIISSGSIVLTDIEARGQTFQDMTVTSGTFGERAILESEARAATARASGGECTVYTLTKHDFTRHIGDIEELKRNSSNMNLLKSIPCFANTNISDSEYEALIDSIKMVTYNKKDVIYKQGDNVDSIYFIHSGEVSATKGPKGAQADVRKIQSHFGYDCFLNEEDLATETVTATKDLEVGVLSLDSIVGVLRNLDRLKGSESVAQELIAFEHLKRHKVLGAGAFGKVWLCSDNRAEGNENQEAYALKVQKKRQLLNNNHAGGIIREAGVMRSLDHPFILKLFNVYQDDEAVYFLLNFIQGGELYSLIEKDGQTVPLNEPDTRFYAAGVLVGLSHMHTRSILYRDLKPENILIAADGYPVIVDLGFAKKTEERSFTMCGSPIYIAPEVVLSTGHGKAFDHWAWGIMVHELLSADVPFRQSAKISHMKLLKHICKGKLKYSPILGEDALDLVKALLVVDEAERLGSLAGGVKDIKKHAWFKDIDFDAISAKRVEAPWKPDVKNALDAGEFGDFSHEEYEPETHPSEMVNDMEQIMFRELNDIMKNDYVMPFAKAKK